MVSYGDVRRWRDQPLHESVGSLNTLCTTLVGLSDESSDAGKTYRWHGEAASAAATNLRNLHVGLEDLVSEVAAMRTAMGQAADTVTGLRHGIAEAESLASRYYLGIEDDGSLRDTASFSFPSERDKAAWEADRERIKAELADRVKEIIRRADDLDNDLSTVVSTCLERGGVGDNVAGLTEAARAGGDAGGLSMLEPPQGGTVAANAAWWSTLGEGGKAWVLANHPEWIGNLDGVPAHYRDLANRARIPLERAGLEAEREAYLADPRNRYVRQDGYYGVIHTAEFDQLEAKLASLDQLEEMLTRPDRHLLALDLSGERAKAAISIGDVDTADHVSVFTPGMNSTINGGQMAGYDEDMRELREKTQKELVRTGNGNESVAVVTWLNYEPPLSSDFYGVDAASDARATDGANRLAPFLEGINASRPDDPHLTALGHSYGSLTTGIALRDHPTTGVDDAVFFGSPGLGVEHATQLNIPEGHGYNLEADEDPIADLGTYTGAYHGTDPSDLPGLHQLSTGESTTPDGRPLAASYGHSEYLRAGDKDTTSEWNLANIIAGTGVVR